MYELSTFDKWFFGAIGVALGVAAANLVIWLGLALGWWS